MGGYLVRALMSFDLADVSLIEAFRAGIFMFAPDLEVFFSPVVFDEHRALKVNDADAFLLFIGEQGLSSRQLQECHTAIERNKRDDRFVVVPVLAAGARVPDALPRDLNCIEAPVVTDRDMLRRVVDALSKYDALNGSNTTRSAAHRFWHRVRKAC